MINQMLKDRNLPTLRSREEMLRILQENEYGFLPPDPDYIKFQIKENIIPNFCAGNAVCHQVVAVCGIGSREFSFPFHAVLPTAVNQYPFFIHINFRDCVPDRYMPTEELIDNGFAVLSFCYEDVTSDNNDFTDGLSGVLYPDGIRAPTDAGKIAMWAWAAQRVMDYAQTRGDILDLTNAIVCGHSRLGKTALLAAATDTRFAVGYSNDSGCSGAAITRNKQGETVRDICSKFSYWFCRNYKTYVDREHEMPFDQHYLLASIAPRRVLVGSATEDIWADPVSEFLCCTAAAEAFGGFPCGDVLPEIGRTVFGEKLGFHLRKGKHYFSRADWLKLMEFAKNR